MLPFLLFMLVVPLERIKLLSVSQAEGIERYDQVEVESLLKADNTFRGCTCYIDMIQLHVRVLDANEPFRDK